MKRTPRSAIGPFTHRQPANGVREGASMQTTARSTLVLVHTIPLLVPAFDRWCSELLPGIRVLHVLDEPMLELVRRRGSLAREDEERLGRHVAEAEAVGADAVLVTCSTMSPAVEAIKADAGIPVFAIDAALAREAMHHGDRIAVVATAATALTASFEMLDREMARCGRHGEIRQRLVPNALPALLNGEPDVHDSLVAAAVAEEAGLSDVVVLAQATMTRVLDAIDSGALAVPV